MDRLHIRDLRLRCVIGVDDDERRDKQDVVLQLTLHADLAEACRTDDFARTVDYRAVKKRVVRLVEESRFLLLEALAQAVADECLREPRVERVDVLVEKPGALRFARTVGVEALARPDRNMTTAYVGVGSNIDPEAHVPAALRLLAERERVTASSTFYRTPALGAAGAPAFVNGVWRVETARAPRALKFEVLRPIEQRLGRRRTADKYAARTIDLDVLVHGDAVLAEPDLAVPDPELPARPFLAVPLCELAPELVVPGSGRRLADIVAGMSREGLEPLAALTARLRAEVEHGSQAGRASGA